MFLLFLAWTVSCVGTELPEIAGDRKQTDSQGKIQTTCGLLKKRGLINYLYAC